jgi:hypothetical protein
MKPWYTSKTIWLHTATLMIMVAGYAINNQLITDPQVLKSVIAAQAVTGMVVRVFTSQSIGSEDTKT